MDKSIGILDKDYTLWVKELVKRYPWQPNQGGNKGEQGIASLLLGTW